MNMPPTNWPLRETSARVNLGEIRWHVQTIGRGPDVMLLHGAGASTHSWRKLVPLMPGFRLIMPDLPGQGFSRSRARARMNIDGMAEDLAALITAQGWKPKAMIGHSAGAALAFRLSEILRDPPDALIGINAALGPFEGFAGWLFPKLARGMAMSPMVAHVVARLSSRQERVTKLLESTGSRLDAEGIALYRHLIADPAHIEGTLWMMAQWRLEPLMARLSQTQAAVLLIAAQGDVAVPADVSRRAARMIPRAEFHEIPRLGHLVHEEDAAQVAALILPFLARHLASSGAA